MPPAWLPDIIPYTDFAGDWTRFIDDVYAQFKADFIDSRPTYSGKPVTIYRNPFFQNKEAGFWHITSEGGDESQRTPALRRCERVCWIRAIIENSHDLEVRVWGTIRKGKDRICMWIESQDFAVVLEKRATHYILITAFHGILPHQRRKFLKEHSQNPL